MAAVSTSGPETGAELVPVNDARGQREVATKVFRYHNPYSLSSSVKGRQYASSVVTSQETMLENLRYIRRELEREDRKIARFQKEMLLSQQSRRPRHNNHDHSENARE